MWTTNAALVVQDRLDLFVQTVVIEFELSLFEQQHGRCAECADLRRRLDVVRQIVLEELSSLLADAPRTIH